MTEAERYQTTRLADVDGDGYVDLLVSPPPGTVAGSKVYSGGGLGWWGAGESVTNNWDFDALFSYAHDNGTWTMQGDVIDLDGDGSDEFVAGGVKTRNSYDAPGLMRRIDNGTGGIVTVEYAKAHDESVVTRAGGRAPRAGFVVKSVRREATSAGPAAQSNYAYEGPVFNQDSYGRWGFRGYTRVEETTPLQARVETVFDYSVRWDGLPVESSTFTSDGALHEWSHTQYGQFTNGMIQNVHVIEHRSQTVFPGTSPGRGGESPIVVRHSTYAPKFGGWGIWVLDRVDEWVEAPSALVPQPASQRSMFTYQIDNGPSTYHIRPDQSVRMELRNGTFEVVESSRELWSGPRNIASEEQVDVTGTLARTERTYFASGQVETVTRPVQIARRTAGQAYSSIRIAYDAHQVAPTVVTDEAGGFTATTLDLGTGAVLVQTAPYRAADAGFLRYSRVVIDGFARPLEVYRRIESGASLTEALVGRYIYTDGLSPKVREEVRRDYGGALWIAKESLYDGHGRVWKVIQYGGDAPAETKFQYDAADGLVAQTSPNPRADNALPVTHYFARDSLGRVTQVHAWGLSPLRVVYDGTFVRRHQDTSEASDGSEGADKTLFYDVDGQLVRVDEVTDDGVASTTYEYDANGNLEHIVDADGVESMFQHDLAGRRTHVIRGERVWSYIYDLHGNLLSETTPVPAGASAIDYVNTFTYDALDRQTSIRVGRGGIVGGPAAAEGNHGIINFEYDAGCEGPGWSGYGSLCRVLLPYGTIRYGFRADGSQSVEARDLVVSLGAGAPVTVAERLDITANALGAPIDVKHTRNGVVSLIRHGYDGVGLPETVGFASGSTTSLPTPTTLATLDRSYTGVVRSRATAWGGGQTWTFDDLGRVTSTSATPACNGQICTTVPAVGETLDYLESGNLETLLDHASGLTFSYEYDRQHQLLGVSASDPAAYAAAFSYSPNGRLRTAYVGSSNPTSDVFPRDVVYSYPDDDISEPVAALHDVASGAPIGSFEYDASGNLQRRTADGRTLRFWYDAVDQLRAVQEEGTALQETYLYDHTGNRILAYSTARGQQPARVRHWFGGAETAYTTTSAVEKSEIFVGIDGAPVARIQDGDVAGAAILISSTLGHLLAALEPDGSAIARFTYGPFGEIVRAEGAGADDFRRRFNGKELDDFTDLAYYGFRYYDRLTMTWTQPDPLFRVAPDVSLESPRDAALYAFSLNNPVRFVDPNGLTPNPPNDPSQNGDRDDPEVRRETVNCEIDPGNCKCHVSCRQREEGEPEDDYSKKQRRKTADADDEGIVDAITDAASSAVVIAVEWVVPQSPEEFAASVVCTTAKKACAAVANKLSKVAKKVFRVGGKGSKVGRKGSKVGTRSTGGKAPPGGAAPPPSSTDDLLTDARPGRVTKGRTKQYEKSGGMTQANADFDALGAGGVRDLDNGGRIGTLADGRIVLVRPTSSGGLPTLEIQDGKNYTKIRYND